MSDEVVERVLVFDLDGTIFKDFLERDKVHIKRIFSGNKVVMFIDKVARFVNSFDIIKNSMIFLKLRLAVYSIFVSKSYKQIMKEYEKWYKEEALWAIVAQKQNFRYLNRYKIIILSNNLFSKDLKIEERYLGQNCTLITSNSKLKTLRKLKKKNTIRFMIGNNFSDDIFSSWILSIENIYIGKSKFVKMFSNHVASNFSDVIKIVNSN